MINIYTNLHEIHQIRIEIVPKLNLIFKFDFEIGEGSPPRKEDSGRSGHGHLRFRELGLNFKK